MKGLLRILPVIAMVAIALPGMEKKGSFDITEKKGSFDLTSIAAPADIADFVRQAAAREDDGMSVSLADRNTGKWPEFPTTPG